MVADVTATKRADGCWRALEPSPDRLTWAVVSTPPHPSLAERNPATLAWRNLLVDPDLCGLAVTRARPRDIALETTGQPADASDSGWPLPVPAVLPGTLAWHPHRPLLAGLALNGWHAQPWIADYQRRSVRRYPKVRAATSLTELGGGAGTALAWHGDRLLFLQPPDPPPPVPSAPLVPVVHEAAGPATVVFAPGVEDLDRHAAAHLSTLDVRTGRVDRLTPALLVGGLHPAPTGGQLLVRTARGTRTGHPDGLDWEMILVDPIAPAARRRLPADARWALDDAVTGWFDGHHFILAGPDGTEHRLPGGPPPEHWWPMWRDGRPLCLVTGDGRWSLRTGASIRLLAGPQSPLLVNTPPRAVAEGIAVGVRDRTGQPGLAVVDMVREEMVVAWATAGESRASRSWLVADGTCPGLVTTGPAGGRRYRHDGEALVEHFPSPPEVPTRASTGPPTPARRVVVPTPVGSARLKLLPGHLPGPALLWIRAAAQGGPGPEDDDLGVPVLVDATGHPGGVLDLPLHWPSDARLPYLHEQVVAPVRTALAQLDTVAAGQPVVVAGHSFGATLALYAMAHLPELGGAVAHSGCYNRTLNPSGFQYERRSYWQVPEVYHAFSAVHFADRLDRPVLVVHGAEDLNPATSPEQAVQLYRAVVSAGGRARLMLLPGEGHTLRYAESLQAVAEEQRRWLGQLASSREAC